MRTSSRLALIGGVSAFALATGLSSAAVAQPTAVVDINFTTAPASILTMLADTDTATVIIDKESILGANSGSSETDDNNIIAFTLVGGNDIVNLPESAIYSITRGNNTSSSIGQSSAEGALIITGQEIVPAGTDVLSLSAITNDNLILSILAGDGQNITASVNNNQVTGNASFNTAFGTIQTEIPNDLDVTGAAGRYDSDQPLFDPAGAFIFPTQVDQRANYNIASVQVASGFANGNAGAGLTTASVDDTTILLARATLADGTTISGNFQLTGNLVSSRTLGNGADNSIILESGEAQTFEGRAFVSSTQISSDTTVPGVDEFPAISASTDDTNIIAGFAAILVQPPFLSSAQNLNVSVDGNRVASAAAINSSVNLIGFDGDLAVAGDSNTGIRMGVGTAADDSDTRVRADMGVVNNQSSGSLIPLTAQNAQAFTADALILFTAEDIDLESNISVDGNTVSSSATGNTTTLSISNHDHPDDGIPDLDLAEGTASIVGSFANANRQFIQDYGIIAEVLGSTVGAWVGTENDGAATFGGLSGDSTLSVDNNLFSANATANAATASVDIAGSSIVSNADALGARINSDRNAVPTPVFQQRANGGVTLMNWQLANNLGGGFAATAVARLEDTSAEVLINYDGGTVNAVDAPEIADATISASGNGFVASATINGYDGAASLASGTSLEGSIAALSFQTTNEFLDSGQYVANAEIVDGDGESGVFALLGVTGNAQVLTVNVDGNTALALANGNDSSIALSVAAETSIATQAEPLASGRDARIRDDVSVPAIEVRVTDIAGRAGFLAASDQTLLHGVITSNIQSFSIQAVLSGPGDEELHDAALSMADNRVVSQALGNSATNSIAVGDPANPGTGISVVPDTTGAIAGVISSQTTAQSLTLAPTGEGFVNATLVGNELLVDVLGAGDSNPITVTNTVVTVGDGVDEGSLGNVMQAVAFANTVDNSITTSSLTLNTSSAAGVLATAETLGDGDYLIGVEGAALYVLNRQRNEGTDPTLETGANVGALAAGNQISVNVDGGGGAIDTVVSVGSLGTETTPAEPNVIQATAAANVANNSISINPGNIAGTSTTADASAAINSRQGNSGGVSANNEFSTIEANLNGNDIGPEHLNVRINVDGNVIGSSATGNSATNEIAAQAGTSLNGTNGGGLGGAYIGTAAGDPGGTVASIHTDTAVGSIDTNPDAFVNGNLTVLNTQRNYVPADAPVSITSQTLNAEFSLNVSGDLTTTTTSPLSLSGNQALSQAAANVATNGISTVAATGSPDFISALNNQAAVNTTVSSAVVDTTVALNVPGTYTGGTIAVDGNRVVASADVNSATNTLTSQGGVGALPSATIVNHQTSSGSSASSSVTGTTISSASGSFGGGTISNSTVSVSNNQIGTSTTINNSVNKIGAPGQSFTRSSSF